MASRLRGRGRMQRWTPANEGTSVNYSGGEALLWEKGPELSSTASHSLGKGI